MGLDQLYQLRQRIEALRAEHRAALNSGDRAEMTRLASELLDAEREAEWLERISHERKMAAA